jgi:tetratricopeptide (TPR) repeat protein
MPLLASDHPVNPTPFAASTLFAVDRLRIDLLRRAASDPPGILVVTFTPSLNRTLEGAGFGGDFLLRHGHDVLAIKSTADDWFQSLPEAAFVAVDNALRGTGYSGRAAYGSSMGGYAAIAFARRLRCGTVLALSPQFRIDDPADTRWQNRAAAIRWRYRIVADCVAPGCRYVICHDPLGLDDWHAQQLMQTLGAANVEPVPVRHGGHPVSHFLAEAGVLRDFALRVLNGGPATLPPLRQRRRASQAYLTHLARLLQDRGRPHLALRLIESSLRGAPAHVRPGLHQQRSALLSALGHHDDALLALAQALALRPDSAPLQAEQSRQLANAGRLPEALAAIDRAVTLDDQVPGFHLEKSRLHWRLRQRRAALAALWAGLHSVHGNTGLSRTLWVATRRLWLRR